MAFSFRRASSRRAASPVVCEPMGAQLAQKCSTTGSFPPPLSACTSAAVATACRRAHTARARTRQVKVGDPKVLMAEAVRKA